VLEGDLKIKNRFLNFLFLSHHTKKLQFIYYYFIFLLLHIQQVYVIFCNTFLFVSIFKIFRFYIYVSI
jgi:hypothetical protein